MEEILIRPVEPIDLPEVKRLNDLAFGGPDEGRLVELLHARGKAIISLAAVYQGKFAGHILFSPVEFRPPHPEIRALGLAPLAVLPGVPEPGHRLSAGSPGAGRLPGRRLAGSGRAGASGLLSALWLRPSQRARPG